MIPSPLSSPSSATADARLASNVGHGPSADVNPLITELKTRAHLRLKALTAAAAPKAPAADEAAGRRGALRLRDALAQVSRELGFAHWEHARRVLGGQALPGEDFGAFWHAPRCNGLLSHWFASHADACEALAAGVHRVLLPYRKQFVVVDEHYLRELGLSIDDPAWGELGRDLALGYGTSAWLALARQRLLASRVA
jgi:hypothetical protein